MRKQLILLAAGLFFVPQSATAMPEGEMLRDEGNAGANVHIDNGGLHIDGGSINATINAQIQAGYRYIGFDNSADRGLDNTSSFDINSARIEVAGDAEGGDVGYKLEYDFVSGIQGDGEDGGALLDAWAEYRFSEKVNIRAGQMKAPFSKQQLAETNQLQFPNRSIATLAFLPGDGDLVGRDRGVLLHGTCGNTGAEYQIGVFNGEGANSGATDTNVAGVAHINYDIGEYGSRLEEGDLRDGDRPFAATAGLGLSLIHI